MSEMYVTMNINKIKTRWKENDSSDTMNKTPENSNWPTQPKS